MPHSWQLDERDALEILYKEYNLNAGREDDMHAIFTRVFVWQNVAVPQMTLLRDQWRGREKAGRSPNWINMHSKPLAAYTPAERARRAGVRVQILTVANAQGIQLTPTQATAPLHAAALATMANVTVAGAAVPPPAVAPLTMASPAIISTSTLPAPQLAPTNGAALTGAMPPAPNASTGVSGNTAPTTGVTGSAPSSHVTKTATRMPQLGAPSRGGNSASGRAFVLVGMDDEATIVDDSEEDTIVVANPRKRPATEPLQPANDVTITPAIANKRPCKEDLLQEREAKRQTLGSTRNVGNEPGSPQNGSMGPPPRPKVSAKSNLQNTTQALPQSHATTAAHPRRASQDYVRNWVTPSQGQPQAVDRDDDRYLATMAAETQRAVDDFLLAEDQRRQAGQKAGEIREIVARNDTVDEPAPEPDATISDDPITLFTPPLRRALQKAPAKMNMVHSSHLRLATDFITGQRIECSLIDSEAYIPYESTVFKYSGVVSLVYFFSFEGEGEAARKIWRSEVCMVCNTEICPTCIPNASAQAGWKASAQARLKASPTNKLPFVHSGLDCELDLDKNLVYKPNLDHANTEGGRDQAADVRQEDWKFDGYMPEILEEKMVVFGQWGLEKAMICVRGQCKVCDVVQYMDLDSDGELVVVG